VETRRLGRLGHNSSVLIYGGAALASIDPTAADESISFALANGINHFDTSDDYGDSEKHLGRWMSDVRDDIFLATKTTARTRDGAARTIETSLERLRVDSVDLLQLHAIGDLDELEVVMGAGGALEAVVAARDEGIVKGIGITGHGVRAAATHLEALRRFPFDTVLTPYSYRLCREDEFLTDFEQLAAEIRRQDAGLMLIKHVARNQWRDSEKPRYATWYEPFDEQRSIDAAVAFALARSDATGLCTAGDVRLLPKMVEAEQRAGSMSTEEIDQILGHMSDYESPFVTTSQRRGPEWLKPTEKRHV
jgi:aryl-alcohol dehydrogenase-like predicted oxidoreductase